MAQSLLLSHTTLRRQHALKLLDWLKVLYPVGAEMPDVIVYDNACTVAKSIRMGAPNHNAYQQLTNSTWAVDRFHFSGHSAGDVVCRTYVLLPD